jgi:hypothetical protein
LECGLNQGIYFGTAHGPGIRSFVHSFVSSHPPTANVVARAHFVFFVHETMSVVLEEKKNPLLRYHGYGGGEEEDGDDGATGGASTAVEEEEEEQQDNMRGAIMASLKTPVVSYKGIGLSRGFLLLLCVPLIALLCFQLPSSLDDGSRPQNQASAHAVPCTSAGNGTLHCVALHRSLFPQRFVFGTATAAYQVCSNNLFIYICLP